MSDYEGLEYEARVDEAMDDVLGRDGWCGVCGAGAPPTRDVRPVRCPPVRPVRGGVSRRGLRVPGVRQGGPWTRYDRIMALAAARACPTSWPTRPARPV